VIRRGAIVIALVAVTAAITIAGLGLQPARSATVSDLLPDLRMARPTSIRITTSASGRKLLRFTTTIGNVGRGRFELVAHRPSLSYSTMTVRQRIFRDNGTTRYVATKATSRFAGDGHNHWHIRRVATYDLIDAHARRLRGDRKIGFCFFDTSIYDRSVHGFRPIRRYFEKSCGSRSSLTVRMGISVGWGDTYSSALAYQWIDVTGIPTGTYWLVATADKDNFYRESNETNNCSWAKVRLSGGASVVTVIARGTGCTPPGVTPPVPPSPSPPPSSSPAPSAEPSPSEAGDGAR
jgi:hypothetical protein